MKKILTQAAVFGILLGVAHAQTRTSSTGKQLDVPYRPQLSNNWCWAASAHMIMRYWYLQDTSNAVLTQCEQAIALNRSFKRWIPIPVNCPIPLPPPDTLNQAWAPFCVGEPYTKSTTSIPLSWDSVKYQLDNNMPFATEWSWEGVTDSTRQNSGNHWLIVTGYQSSKISGENYISYCDPWAADSAVHKIILFSEYQHPKAAVFLNHPGYQYTRNIATYYNIMPAKP